MKSLVLALMAIIPSIYSNSQELLRNGSFEDTLGCPVQLGEISKAKFWYSDVSSDYYNDCSDTLYTANNGDLADQIPKDGKGYIGLILGMYSSEFPNTYTEIASSKLTTPLQKDSFYCFSSYINLQDFCFYKTSAYNILFSNDSLRTLPLPKRFNKNPDILFEILDVNTIDWSKKSKGYIADSAYEYIHIGNFLQSTEYIVQYSENVLVNPKLVLYSYYLIDSLSLYKLRKPYSTLNYDCEYSFAEVAVSGADSVKWYDITGNLIDTQNSIKILNPKENDKYIVIYSLCNYTFNDTITIAKCNEAKPELPNIITANGDGINDAFLIKELPLNSSLTVYNRWGAEIYKADNYQNNWQGETKTLGMESKVVDGTYFYVLVTPQGNVYMGSVTVVGN